VLDDMADTELPPEYCFEFTLFFIFSDFLTYLQK